MKNSFRLTEEAERDLYDAARYIAQDNPHAALELLESFEETCDLLSEMPEMGSTPRLFREELQELRMMRITKFTKYLIFYRRFKREGIEIIRVIHAARDYPAFF